MRRLALVALVCLTLPPAPARAANAAVSMAQIRFNPPEVQVGVGGKVTWSNDDNQSHEVTAEGGTFDSSPTCQTAASPDCMDPGAKFTHTFRQAGRFPYYCSLHGGPGRGMTGVVTVG